MDYLFLSLLWGGYCFLHSYLISISFTEMLSRILKRYYAFYRLFYIIISVLLLVPLINYSHTFASEVVFEYGFPWSLIRVAILLSSLLFFFRAFLFDYDPLSFFGFRQIIDFYKKKEIYTSDENRKTGLLGVVRHPMYLALLVFLWCQTFTTIDILANIILSIYVIIGTYLEEKKLLLEFGQAYEVYQDQVPMLIPFTKPHKRRFA